MADDIVIERSNNADAKLADFDRAIAKSAYMKVLDGGTIPFQFAPKIIGDSNSSNWLEKDIWAIEMLRLHAGSVGRRIVVEWEYIASDSIYNSQKISGIMTTLKSYFFAFSRNRYPVITFRHTLIVSIETYFRLRNLNITHGPEIVDNAGIYPLYTKVNAVLELATNVSGPIAAGTGAANAPTRGPGKINVPPINRAVEKKWY